MTQQEYDQKKRECWEEFLRSCRELNMPRSKFLFDWAFDRAYALGKLKADDLSKNSSEPTPSEPKFKVGDRVRIVNDISHNNKYNGDITEIVYVDESDPNMPYKVDIYDEEFGGGLWYQESDLEPYTEPNFDKEEPTFTDDCQSQCQSQSRNLSQETANCDKEFDNILKDSFREHNRLHIAAMIMSGLLASGKEKHPVRRAMDLAGALIAEAAKGGEK